MSKNVVPTRPQSSLKASQYTLQKCIGQGSFSKVFKAIHRQTNQVYALKIMSMAKVKSQPKVFELMQSELKILSSIKNDNIIRLHEYFIEAGYYYYVMEFCNGGDLEKYLKSKPKKTIPEAEALGFFKQLLNGFKALHAMKAMHRDFKPANVLINDGVLKIADLGFSKIADLGLTILGTGLYMAPEIGKSKSYDNRIDIWSLGVSLYEMLFGNVPFDALTEKDLMKKIHLNEIDFNYNRIEISKEMQELLKRMLTPALEKRITWKEIYNHPILNEPQPQPMLGSLGLKGSVLIQMSRLELERQHQNENFSKNKEFYKDENNTKFNIQDVEKLLEKNQPEKESLQEDQKPKEDPKIKEKENENLNEQKRNLVKTQFTNEEEKNFQSNPQKKRNSLDEETKQFQNVIIGDESSKKKEKTSVKDLLPEIQEEYDEKLAEKLRQKEICMKRYEKHYFYRRNVISHHAKVLGEGFRLKIGENYMCHYFIFAKVILLMSKEFLENLRTKNNFLDLKEHFPDFASSKTYSQLFSLVKEETAIYLATLEQIEEDLKNFEDQKDPLYQKVLGEMNKFQTDKHQEVYKETLHDFVFNNLNLVSELKKTGKNDLAKEYASHFIELCECFQFEIAYAFDEKEENGFDFDKHESLLKAKSMEDLESLAKENLDKLEDSD